MRLLFTFHSMSIKNKKAIGLGTFLNNAFSSVILTQTDFFYLASTLRRDSLEARAQQYWQ